MDFGPDVIPTEPYGRYAGSSSRRRLDTYSRRTSEATWIEFHNAPLFMK
jgi:hypothetical protein